jgi:hypothetical protein
LDGNSLLHQSASELASRQDKKDNEPRDIRGVKHTKPNRILMVIDANILLQPQNLRIAHIRAVDEGAQKQERQDGQQSASWLATRGNNV